MASPRLVTADGMPWGSQPPMNNGRRASLAPAPAMPETQRASGKRHGGAPRGGVPVARDGYASQAWRRVLPARQV